MKKLRDVAVASLHLLWSTFLLHIPADHSTTVHVELHGRWHEHTTERWTLEIIKMHPNVYNATAKTATAYRNCVHFQILGLLWLLFYSRHWYTVIWYPWTILGGVSAVVVAISSVVSQLYCLCTSVMTGTPHYWNYQFEILYFDVEFRKIA